MKITEIKAYKLQVALTDNQFGWSQGINKGRQSTICQIFTDEGIDGIGEAFYFEGPPQIAGDIIENVFGPMLLGKDPFDTNVIWELLYNSTRDQGQKGVIISAISAIDIALWDIKGKVLGLPVYKLLGGAFRNKAIPYATGLFEPLNSSNPIKTLIAEAVSYRDAGFRGIKMKIGYGVERDVAYIKAVREAIGSEIYFMVDPNHAYNANEAIKLAREIEKYDIFWLEEPVPPEDIDGYLEIKSRTTIPIAGGELAYTRFGFKELINRRAVDVLQPEICGTGGFTEVSKIVSMASAANIQVMPHVWGTNVAIAASLQMYAALPYFPMRRIPTEPLFEYDRSPNPLRENVTIEKFDIKNGLIDIPNKPGIGVTLNMNAIEKYSVNT